MYRVAAIAAIFIAGSLVVAAQDPVPTPTPVGDPPVLKSDAPPPEVKPPVLQGDPAAKAKPSPTPTKDDEVIKVSTDLVTTHVSVLDRNGRFISGLKKQDFSVFENGVKQNITYFQSEEQPFTVILMIDISPSTKYKMDEIHFAAISFVNQLRPTDKVLVLAFDQRIHVLTDGPTSEKPAIYAAIYKATFGSGTSIYEAVNFVTDLDLVKSQGRKAIVLFTDGVDTTSRQATFEGTLATIQEIDALVYPIRYDTSAASGVVSTATGAPTQLPSDIAAMMAARGIAIDPRVFRSLARGQSPAEYAKGKLYLEKLAESSGGRIFDASDIKNLDAAFAGVAEELRRQYSIGYYPEEEGKPGESRGFKIKVGRPNTVVRAKTSYVIHQLRGWKPQTAEPGLVAERRSGK